MSGRDRQRGANVRSMVQELRRFGIFQKGERRLLWRLIIYALAIGLFSLIVPLTVQELVNTFAFAVQPIMVLTLIGLMAVVLLVVGAFRVLQFYANDVLERRIFVRVALPLARGVLAFRDTAFTGEQASRFFETVLLQRALSSLLVDFINVVVSGLIGMGLLVFYHPYFLGFDVLLILAVFAIAGLGRGGLATTLRMSEAKYDTFHWFQGVADNLLHFKSVASAPLILQRADELAYAYVKAREARFKVLLRQYIGSVVLQVALHAGLLGTAGWLVAMGELTLGELVGAEVIIATLLANLESVVKRVYVFHYFSAALVELDHLFALPKDEKRGIPEIEIPDARGRGLRLTCQQVCVHLDGTPVVRDLTFNVQPGGKWAVVCETETVRHLLARRLAGLEPPLSGVIRYNDIDLKELGADTVNRYRGLVLSWQLSLFEGTLHENITVGRPGISLDEVLWALRFVELKDEVEGLPEGLQTTVSHEGKELTPSQKLRLLVARAIVARPPLLILDGALYELRTDVREVILRRICSDEVPWSVVIVTTHPEIKSVVDHVVEAH